jgi:hypothetical protein
VTNSIILYSLIGLGMQGLGFQEIAPTLGRTKTNTGRWVENTKALERTVLKELGKLHP